ncbi:MAG: CusA/CzcA family heavy metal efflux RND transporter [Bacteroidales bacterium]|nr:CusA/CzcA family heavy metal efflux RND transporter [Bacteroidales bacterium]
MIESIIRFSIRNKIIVGLFTLALIGWGTYSLIKLPVDAVPDITNNQVQIISIAPSLAVQEVESFITEPIEVAVANIPDIIELRSISRLGLSVITVVFKDNVDIYWARQQLGERLKEVEEIVPQGLAKIELAPISTGLGEIYQYRLSVAKGYEEKYTPLELRTIQDWMVRRGLLGTPGVADINSYGGYVKQYEVAVNPERLRSLNLTLTDIFEALENNNENTGSAYIDKKPNAFFIRGIGLINSIEDIEKIVVKVTPSGIPVLIRDVAKVQYGSATRYGALVIDTSEAVGGVVMMLKGANAREVIKEVEARIATIQKTLPDGVIIEPFLNRSDLVGRVIGTVSKNLIEGALIVIFILVLMLGNARAGLIVASVIPLSMLFAVSMMNLFGVSGNLMSLGAIDFGLIVDGAVIIVESVVHRIYMSKHHLQGVVKLSKEQMDEHVLDSAKRMMSSATFGQIIILIVYLPILALVGIEGKMFKPMAQVVSFALIGAILLSLTYVPAASAVFLSRETNRRNKLSDRIMAGINRAFQPILGFSLKNKLVVVAAATAMLLLSLVIFSRLGGEFIPQLEEGDLAAGVITLQGGSLTNTIEQVKKANKILLANFPEIKHTVCKIGAGEIPTDPTPMETGDYIITLKPKDEWVSAKSREELIAKMEEALIPLAGVKFEFQQPIQMRFNELLSGSKQDVAIKIFGDDLNTLAELGEKVEQLIVDIDGVEDINVEKVTGLAQIQVELIRDRLAQYGLSVTEVNKILRAAFAGSEAGIIYEGEKRFALVVRYDKDFRKSIDDVKNITVALHQGGQIFLDQIANIEIKSGPAQVSRENTKRRLTIGFNVRNRDVESVIAEVTQKIEKQIKFPVGYYVDYGGQFRNLEAAKQRLSIAIPVALLLIFILLYFAFYSVKQTLLIFTAVPLSAIGGILALWVRGMNFSISAGIGFIALFGVAVLNGIVLIAEFNRLEKEGISDVLERVKKGVNNRLRPVIMTAAVASLGFLPMALSTSAGAEVQKPLATVVIGGLISATLLTLVVLPVLYTIFSTRSFRKILRKRIFKTLTIGIFCLTIFSIDIKSQQKEVIIIDAKQAVRLAIDSNLAIRSSAYAIDEQKWLKKASWDIPKTSIELQYGQFNSIEKDNSITVSQTFAFPTVYIYQNKLAKAQISNAEWQHEISKLEIATQVKQLYWEWVYLLSKQKLLIYQDSLYSGLLKSVEIRVRTGETNKLELLTARSQSLQIKNELQQLIFELSALNQKLQVLLNINASIVPADTALSRLEYIEVSDSGLVMSNPSNALMLKQAEIAAMEKKIERSRMLPEITIGYFSQTMKGIQEVNGISRSFGPADRFYGWQVGLAIPLWFTPYTARTKAAKMKEMAAQTNAEYFERKLVSEYKHLTNEFYKYRNSVLYFENVAIPQANQIIEQATLSYKAGELDYIDYLQSIDRALDIKHNYLTALYNYNQTIISLEFITGKLF